MKVLSKFVAAVLSIFLCATPLLAATPCFSNAQSIPNCGQCCHGMSAMTGMAMMAPMNGGSQAQVSQPPCCKASSADSATLATGKEPQGPVSPAFLHAGGSVALVIPPAPLPDIRPLPDRSTDRRVHSLLCTFLI